MRVYSLASESGLRRPAKSSCCCFCCCASAAPRISAPGCFYSWSIHSWPLFSKSNPQIYIRQKLSRFLSLSALIYGNAPSPKFSAKIMWERRRRCSLFLDDAEGKVPPRSIASMCVLNADNQLRRACKTISRCCTAAAGYLQCQIKLTMITPMILVCADASWFMSAFHPGKILN